jgi:hypothetical protein
MHIYVSSLLKYKIYLYLYNSVREYLHYVTIEFKIQIYICIALLKIALTNQITTYCRIGSSRSVTQLL